MSLSAHSSMSLSAHSSILLFLYLIFILFPNYLVKSDFHVGVVLDMNSPIGRVGWNCIEMAFSDFYAKNVGYKTKLSLHMRDSHGDRVNASLAVLDLLQNVQVQAIIGSQKSTEADFVIDLGHKAQVPVISFSATSPSLSPRSPYFLQAAQNNHSQVKAITAIFQTFKWREVVIIHEKPESGNGFVPYLVDALQEQQVKVAHESVMSVTATVDQIRVELKRLMKMHTRVFIVHVSHTLNSQLFLTAKELGMMSEGYAWIVTDETMNLLGSMDASVVASMEGVLGIKPYVRQSIELEHFMERWKNKSQEELNIYGLWAYDSIWTLAMAAETLGATEFLSENPTVIRNNLTDLTSIKTSKHGVQLLEVISKTRFKGLSGDVYFTNGHMKSSVYQIFNLMGTQAKEVGFWTPEHGIFKELNTTSSMTNLRSIIWPGDSVVIPISGKKLRIGVPVKAGFNELVKVDLDPDTKKTRVSGYSIDVFKLAMEALPYHVTYEFEPYNKSHGSSGYSEMIYQVYLKKYDAVVGDTTITANRSLYVDFTLPYAEGGVSMLVPFRHNGKKSTWVFLKPLTKDLWLTTAAFFIATGIVIWVLEHRINEAFRGPPSQHVGMIFWFPLSTLVFAHRERIVSNLTRFVVVIWIFVVFILNSSFTASLSSILTVEKLKPSVTCMEELQKNGYYVGFQNGSFIGDLLKAKGFDKSKLKPYSYPDDMIDDLVKGSQNGGISAFFDVPPYIKLFIAKYGNNRYTMVGPIHRTEGFGFVFPRGSPLAADVGRAILNISDSDKMMKLDRSLFGDQTSCSDPGGDVPSSSLDVSSFRGLFSITGAVSGLALLVFLVIFLYKNKQVLSVADSGKAIWPKIKTMLKQFDEKDFTSYRFLRKSFTERGRSARVSNVETPPSSPDNGIILFHVDNTLVESVVVEELVDVSLSD